MDRLQADLVTALHSINTLKAQLSEAQANTTRVSAERDRLYKDYQRYLKGSQARVNPFSESDIDNARQNYLAQDAMVKGSVAEQAQIQSQLDSIINGEQSQVVSLRAQLAEAKYNLDQTTVRAPSDGYITQVLIRPGTYAASLPLRPVMVFIPQQKRLIVAQFRQNSLLRLEKGDDAEAVFNALPGQVFRGKLVSILPVVPGGTYQAQGTLQALTVTPGTDGVLATIELEPDAAVDALPDGIYAQVAVYSDHFTHVSVMRKVLLRMTSWMHYLYLLFACDCAILTTLLAKGAGNETDRQLHQSLCAQNYHHTAGKSDSLRVRQRIPLPRDQRRGAVQSAGKSTRAGHR